MVLIRVVFSGTDPHVTAAETLFMMSSGVIVGIVVASLFVLLLLIDLFCFCVNSAGKLLLWDSKYNHTVEKSFFVFTLLLCILGLLMLMCESMRGKPKDEDSKLGG